MAPHGSSSTPPAAAGSNPSMPLAGRPDETSALFEVGGTATLAQACEAGGPPAAEPPRATAPPRPAVELRPSTRRKRSAAAHFEGDRIVVLVPARLRPAERQELADRLVDRLLHQRRRPVRSDDDLAARAAQLADSYLGGVRPSSIRWVDNQERRWGSCSPATGAIRISSRLQHMPGWVLDTILVHELAHLLEATHSPRFHELARRCPRVVEAEAFLAGYSLGLASRGGEPV